MSKVCVTGAGGYIGRHVVDMLIEMNHEVIAVDLKLPSCNQKAIAIETNLFSSDSDLYQKLQSPEYMIHLAWRNGFNHNSDTHIDDLPAHFHFLCNMLDQGLNHLSIMGTMHEIGFWEGEVNESTPTRPLTPYGIAKNALRELMMAQVNQRQQPTLNWLRAYYIYGDDAFNNSIFSRIIRMEKEGKTSFPFTTGLKKFDFIEIHDLAKQIALASTQTKVTGIINVCSGKAVALRDKVSDFINSHGFKIRPSYGEYPERAYDSPAIWGNIDKINAILCNRKEEKK